MARGGEGRLAGSERFELLCQNTRISRDFRCCSKSSCGGKFYSSQRNLFDCTKGRPFNRSITQDQSMFEAIIAFLIVRNFRSPMHRTPSGLEPGPTAETHQRS